MRSFVIKRLLQMIPVLFLVTLISFALIYLSPGDPVSAMLFANGGTVDPEVAAQMRAELGLDQPIPLQYLSWLGGVCTGNLGTSLSSGRPVLDEILVRLPATAFLAFVSLALALAIALPLGVLAATRRNGIADYVVRMLSFVAGALPGFLVAIQLKWFPSMGKLQGVAWVLPVLTLALCEAAVYVRQIRTLVLQELERDYVVALRLRGVAKRDILLKSVLKAVAPTILILVGMTLGQLLGGTAIIETVFNWPGAGQYAVQEIFARDYPVIQGYVLMMSVFFLVINLIVDLLQARIDPRVHAQLVSGARGRS